MTDPSKLQRRLAAILFADVAGFSRLMEADEHATVQRLHAHRKAFQDAVDRHGGRIIDTAGDSILAEFGSVLQAIQAAMAVQSALGGEAGNTENNLAFRIGVNLGEILYSDDGTIYGDAVNVAARVQTLSKAGGICVSGIVHDQVARKMELTFEDLGRHSVKNIKEPVHIYRILMPDDIRLRPATNDPKQSTMTQPSIAVLPFSNMSGDPEQEYFSDGITEDIITDLSKIAGLFVIARNSSFVYKGKSVKIPEVARDLGVRYVLEGSVRRAGGRVRVTAQLIDGTDGGHVWGERYDRQLDDIFAVQDDVTQKIVEMLKVKLTPEELRRVKETNTTNMEAYDALMRGRNFFYQFTPDAIQKAKKQFNDAIDIDAHYVDAYAFLSRITTYEFIAGWDVQNLEKLDQAIELANRAIRLNEHHAGAHAALGWAYLWKKQANEAIHELEKSLELDPNDSQNLIWLSYAYSSIEKGQEALKLAEKAIRLDPFYPDFYLHAQGCAYLAMDDYEESISVSKRCINQSPNFFPAYLTLASSCMSLGREEEAIKWAKEIRRISPNYVIGVANFWMPDTNQYQLLNTHLEKLGFPYPD